jgi:hypothetical protein
MRLTHFTRSLDFWFFASRQRTEIRTSFFFLFSPDCKPLSFFSLDRKERNKEKVTATFHPFLDGIFYSSQFAKLGVMDFSKAHRAFSSLALNANYFV